MIFLAGMHALGGGGSRRRVWHVCVRTTVLSNCVLFNWALCCTLPYYHYNWALCYTLPSCQAG